MLHAIDQHRAELESLCRRFHVKSLELFGSAATESFNPERSDLDFLVDFLPLEPGAHSKAYFGLWFALQDLFRRDVDLVEVPAVTNPYFLKQINKHRQLLYAA